MICNNKQTKTKKERKFFLKEKKKGGVGWAGWGGGVILVLYTSVLQ